jgi:hypothetical protein
MWAFIRFRPKRHEYALPFEVRPTARLDWDELAKPVLDAANRVCKAVYALFLRFGERRGTRDGKKQP